MPYEIASRLRAVSLQVAAFASIAAGSRTLAAAYNTPDRADFYAFVRALDAAKVALRGENKTLILTKDSPLAKLFNNQ